MCSKWCGDLAVPSNKKRLTTTAQPFSMPPETDTTQIKLALSGDKRRSLNRILLTAMFLEGHKNGISSIESGL